MVGLVLAVNGSAWSAKFATYVSFIGCRQFVSIAVHDCMSRYSVPVTNEPAVMLVLYVMMQTISPPPITAPGKHADVVVFTPLICTVSVADSIGFCCWFVINAIIVALCAVVFTNTVRLLQYRLLWKVHMLGMDWLGREKK